MVVGGERVARRLAGVAVGGGVAGGQESEAGVITAVLDFDDGVEVAVDGVLSNAGRDLGLVEANRVAVLLPRSAFAGEDGRVDVAVVRSEVLGGLAERHHWPSKRTLVVTVVVQWAIVIALAVALIGG